MLIALWILNVLLALTYVAAGVQKLLPSRGTEPRPGPGPGPGYSRVAGVAEVLGAIGLIAPLATQIAPVLTPLAAVGLAVVMAAAIAYHVSRKEAFIVPLVLGVLDVASAILGFLVLT